MYFLIFVLIFVFPIFGMEQPLPVVQLQNYTLVSNDGKEIALEGDLVRDFAPGLAEKFRSGFKESQGRITISDLDSQALQNFKILLEQTKKKELDLRRYNDVIIRDVELRMKLVPHTQYVGEVPREQKELEVQTRILIEGMHKVRAEAYKYAAQLKEELQKLPEIGEHFLALFNEAVKWQVPYILELALAQFAADQIDIKDGYKEFKDLDPRAQLFYLHEVGFSSESIISVYQWIVALAEAQATKAIQSNKELYDDIIEKIVEFTVQNIVAILAKNPTFKNLFAKEEYKAIGELLRQELVKMNLHFFTTIIRPAVRWPGQQRPYVDSLGGSFIALHDTNPQNNIYDWQNKIFRSSTEISKSDIRYILWGPDLLVGYTEFYIYISDINTGEGIFYNDLQSGNIEQVLPITNNKILIRNWHNELLTFIYDREHKNLTKAHTQSSVADILSINENEYLLVNKYKYQGNYNLKISLNKVGQTKPVKQTIINMPTQFFIRSRKISNQEVGIIVGLVQIPEPQMRFKYLNVSIPDLHIVSLDLPQLLRVGYSPMTFEYLLAGEEGSNKISLYNVASQTMIPLPEKLSSVVALDKNRIAAFDQQSNIFVILFIPHVSTLSEILDELQRRVVPRQEPQKRPASPEPIRPVPAAAKGLNPEAKRQRPEKPNG